MASKKQEAAYWKKRFEILESSRNDMASAEALKIQKKFKAAQKEIEDQITLWYQRFADNNEISMAKARKLLSTNELAELNWDVKEYIKYGEDNAMFGLYSKELENASAKFHINKLEALKIKTQMAVDKLYYDYDQDATKLLGDIYQSSYYQSIFEIQKGFGVGWDIASVNEDQLKSVLSKPWTTDRKTFSNRIWSSRSQLVNEIHTQLTRNVLLGKAPDEAIAALAKKFEVSKNQAGRLIMTESAFFGSAAQKDAFGELDVDQYEIVATLDSHTSEICQELDGQIFDMKDFQPGVTAPPFHVWCRTTTVPYFPDNYTERASRNEDGKIEYVPGNMTYKDWKTKYVDDPGLTTEYFDLQFKLKNTDLNTKWEGIWKDPVTLQDFASKQSSIDAKKQYFQDKVNSSSGEDQEKFKKLLAEVNDYEQQGQEYTAMKTRLKQIEAEYKKKAQEAIDVGLSVGDNPVVSDAFSQERKDAAIWARSTAEADSVLREKCGEIWRSSTGREKDAIYRYTQNSGGFNRPLAGFEKPWTASGSGWERRFYKGANNVWIDYEQFGDQIRAMTDMISKSTYDFDMWLQRGCDANSIENFLDLAEDVLSDMTDDELQQFVGATNQMTNFLSTGVAKGQGFSHKSVILNIYTPKGSQVMYAEPFSAFSGDGGRNWDGIKTASHFGGESEAIIQRGGTYTITKIERSRGKIYIDLEHHPEKGYNTFQQDPAEWTGSTKTK